jgi:hypothetical protein
MAAKIFQVNDSVHEYLARIGARGGMASRRFLSKTNAKEMVAIREAMRAAKRRGRPLSEKERKQLALSDSFELTSQRERPRRRRGLPFDRIHKH